MTRNELFEAFLRSECKNHRQFKAVRDIHRAFFESDMMRIGEEDVPEEDNATKMWKLMDVDSAISSVIDMLIEYKRSLEERKGMRFYPSNADEVIKKIDYLMHDIRNANRECSDEPNWNEGDMHQSGQSTWDVLDELREYEENNPNDKWRLENIKRQAKILADVYIHQPDNDIDKVKADFTDFFTDDKKNYLDNVVTWYIEDSNSDDLVEDVVYEYRDEAGITIPIEDAKAAINQFMYYTNELRDPDENIDEENPQMDCVGSCSALGKHRAHKFSSHGKNPFGKMSFAHSVGESVGDAGEVSDDVIAREADKNGVTPDVYMKACELFF